MIWGTLGEIFLPKREILAETPALPSRFSMMEIQYLLSHNPESIHLWHSNYGKVQRQQKVRFLIVLLHLWMSCLSLDFLLRDSVTWNWKHPDSICVPKTKGRKAFYEEHREVKKGDMKVINMILISVVVANHATMQALF